MRIWQGSGVSFLLFTAGSRLCAMSVRHVTETLRPLPVEPANHAPVFVTGLALLRGVPTPIVDTGLLLGDAALVAPGRLVAIRTEHQAALDRVIELRQNGTALEEVAQRFEVQVTPIYTGLRQEIEGYVVARQAALVSGRDDASAAASELVDRAPGRRDPAGRGQPGAVVGDDRDRDHHRRAADHVAPDRRERAPGLVRASPPRDGDRRGRGPRGDRDRSDRGRVHRRRAEPALGDGGIPLVGGLVLADDGLPRLVLVPSGLVDAAHRAIAPELEPTRSAPPRRPFGSAAATSAPGTTS